MKKAFTLIELMIVIAIIAIIAAIAIPNLLEARKHGNETSAVGSLRTINASQAVYLERTSAQTYASLTQLRDAGYVDSVLGGGSKQGYRFDSRPTSGSETYEYQSQCKPAVIGQTGDRSFFSNQSGVIRFSTTGQASSTSTAIGGK
jgi:type IV pilus assembly protein PilA